MITNYLMLLEYAFKCMHTAYIGVPTFKLLVMKYMYIDGCVLCEWMYLFIFFRKFFRKEFKYLHWF